MLWILETTKLKKTYKHASSLQEKHKEKKRVIGNNLLHGALLLERMFQGSKRFIQLSLKPKNRSLKVNTRKKGSEKFESVKSCLSQSVKECPKGVPECWEASPIYRGVNCLENKLGLLKS